MRRTAAVFFALQVTTLGISLITAYYLYKLLQMLQVVAFLLSGGCQ